jgi:hypothetical protein
MDPLSVAASLVGLLAAGGKIISLLSKVTSVTDAPVLAREALTELNDISTALQHLQDFVTGATVVPAERRQHVFLEHLVASLTGCVTTYSELEKIVDSLKIGSSNMGVFDRVWWAVKENEIKSIVQRLQNHKSSLNLMLSILQSTSINDIQQTVVRLCGLIEQLCMSDNDLFRRLSRLEDSRTHITGPSNVRTIFNDGTDENDNATIRPAATASRNPLEAVNESAMTSFAFDSTLAESRVYSRINLIHSDTHSETSLTSSARRTMAISVFSAMSLAEISNLSMYSLPICVQEISNGTWYIVTRAPEAPLLPQNGEIRVFIKTMTGTTACVYIPANSTSDDLDVKVCETIGGQQGFFYFYVFAMKRIREGAVLADIGIRDESTVHLIYRCAWRGERTNGG